MTQRVICVDANFVVFLVQAASETSPFIVLWDEWQKQSDRVIAPTLFGYGVTGDELIYRDRETELEVFTSSMPWSFNGDGRLLGLVSEAHRIQLAHLFDPMLAVHTSLVEPLPHQITTVYGDMLPRQPLR